MLSNNTKPIVSVLMPIYNTNPQYLNEAIESILSQTFKDFEFIILNDSPENIELDKLVNSYRDDRIKYIKNEKNIGISKSRNKLLSLANGEYIAVFDHDDISLPDRLQEQVDFLNKNIEVGVVGTLVNEFNKNKNFVLKYPEHDIDIRIGLVNNCCIYHTSVMIRKSVLVDNNIKYEEYFSPAEDYRLFARLFEVTKFHNIQNVLVKYRRENTRTSITQKDKMYLAYKSIHLQLCNRYPEYWNEYKRNIFKGTIFRVRLFGVIPIFKIKNKWIYLFDFIPIIKIKLG